MIIKKYELTDETIIVDGRILHRIKALDNFGDVRKGELGGFIEKEKNLSKGGNCWVYNNAKVYDNAEVTGHAKILDEAVVCRNAKVFSTARIHDNAKVFGTARIYNNAEVFMNADVYDNAAVHGNAKVYDNAQISGNTIISGDVKVFGDVMIKINSIIFGNAEIKNINDFIEFKNWWSSGRHFIWTRSNNMWCVGCFYGTGKELIEKAYKDSDISGREYERVVKYVEEIIHNNCK